MQPLVSVLIPVYNVELYVKEAVQSIQNQTYKNLEIIIIDDGSTDDTYSIIEKLARNDDRIKLYKNEKNLKIVKTLNRALTLAKGEYIARMDGDDISELDRIERKVSFLKNNSEYSLVGCSLTILDENSKIIKEHRKLSDFELIKKTLKYVSPVAHIWVARKEIYTELSGYRELSGAEDYDFLLRVISNGKKVTNLSDYYGYQVRTGRIGNTVDNNGLRQRKLHKYIYQNYTDRIKLGYDSYSLKFNIKINNLQDFLFKFSSKYHQKAIENKSNKKYFAFLSYFILSLISPYKVSYYYASFRYKMLVKGDK